MKNLLSLMALIVYIFADAGTAHVHKNTRIPMYGLPGKIVGGIKALPHEFPFQLSLQQFRNDNYKHFCGASLINELWAVTAAHCVDRTNPERIAVVAGEHTLTKPEGKEQFRKVNRIIIHREFKSSTLANDIALLRLDEPLTLNTTSVGTITIPSSSYDASGLATVIGWGVTGEGSQVLSDVLLKVNVPIVTDKECCEAYEPDMIQDSMICAGYKHGGKDSCQGDSGGPLILPCKETVCLVGIVSWGYGCARPGYPGVYTEVSYFSKWIHENAK
ncbi:unnamed protein product [Allacma fusca]|uniref:Phenoloxidase-activating factor 2 n=1 Tax=Allacma fusca TaxID=39272 RepID=A0A8J2K5W1_9HEXA|nr:unnamed protein product [Allacma fusca]